MSNTLRAAQSFNQSRPTPGSRRETKTIGSLLLRKLAVSRSTGPEIMLNKGTMGTSPAFSTLASPPYSRKCYGRPYRKRNHMQASGVSSGSANVLEWLQMSCPQELVPRILAYAGPQKTARLSRTNRFWKSLIEKESTWKIMCEELYKWKEGDEVPESWSMFYRYNPCVPVDYSSVNAAFAVVRGCGVQQSRSIRVLLRPGRYILREAITVQAPSSVRVEIETMDMPDTYIPIDQASTKTAVEPQRKSRRSSKKLRDILACRTIEVENEEEDLGVAEFIDRSSSTSSSYRSGSDGSVTDLKRATLLLRTRRQNEPVIRVRQGRAFLKNLELRHISHGLDIWNGNAAVQIQPSTLHGEQSIVMGTPPTVIMDHVEITSASGRGIVNIDGGHIVIKNCYVHDCAATGIYIGGPGSRALVENTDVMRNGNGNTHHRRGIARGHSGFYLEQGNASIINCNISQNSLTGISAVSPDNAILNLEESELMSNGTFQLELPAMGTVAHRLSVTRNNSLATVGFPRSRSGLVVEE